MRNDSRNNMLDKTVDYYRQVAVVVIAAAGAYWSTTLASEVLLPWTLFLFGGSIIYTLMLPYKRASLIEGRWGLPARVKALTVVLTGLPFYLIPTISVLMDTSVAESLPLFHYQISTFQFEEAFTSFTLLVMGFLYGGLFASIITSNVGIRYTLRRFGFGETEIDDTLKYATDRTGRIELGFSLGIVFTTLYVIAGWYRLDVPNVSKDYFFGALLLILMLVIYGHFFVTYTPSVCPKWPRRLLETILILSILVSIVSYLIGVVLAVASILILHFLSRRGRRKLELQAFVREKQKHELDERRKSERKKLDQDWWAYYFYKLYPTLEYAILGLFALGIALFSILPYFGYQIGLVGFLVFLFVTSGIYFGVPRGYFMLKDYRDELDDIYEKIAEKSAEGAFDFLVD